MNASYDDLEIFSLQSEYTTDEKNLLETLSLPDKKYHTALIVGRFQPLHRGHIFLLHCALRYAHSLIICIGSADTKNEDNPFSLKTRNELLRRAIHREGLDEKIKKTFFLSDTPDDDVWTAQLIQKAGMFDLVIGNNDWVNGLFRQVGVKVVEIPLLQRDVYEGKTIRNKLRMQGLL